VPLRRRLPGWLLAVAVLAAASPSAGAVWTGNAAEVGPFLEGQIEGLMAARQIPGAVAIVVKVGGVVYQRGYGYADPQKRWPVAPETPAMPAP
jgi:CubicO group peptidase (beta-lactamase class C family)